MIFLTKVGNELYGFASKVVNIGDSLHGGIVVSAITETQSMNTERWVLTATNTTNGTITFQDGASNFRVLDVIAYKGITVNVPEERFVLVGTRIRAQEAEV